MAKKDKFQKIQKGGGAISSFQDLAITVAAIEKQAEQAKRPVQAQSDYAENASTESRKEDILINQNVVASTQQPQMEVQRFVRLPNPQIPVRIYNLVSEYCNTFSNMTRQDFVELAIIEKLHSAGQISDGEFLSRSNEVRSRPPRGQRKGLKSIKHLDK